MSDLETADTLRERTDVNEYWFWLLMEADRWALTAGLVLAVFAAFVVLGTVKPVSLRTAMETSDMVETVFAGLVGAIITGTTLVVSITQLVLSQELGSLGSQRDRMNVTMEFRRNTDDLLGRTAPTDPAAYVDELVAAAEARARRLREAFDGAADEQFREAVDVYVDDLLSAAASVRDQLDGVEFGSFDVVDAVLNFDYDRKVNDLRRLERDRADDLTDEQRAAVADLIEELTMYGPVREFVKDLYIQWALVKLSRAILLASVLALAVAGGVALFVDATTVTGSFLGVENMLWLVSAAFAVSLLPFLLFTSYILRLGTLVKQTLTIGPLELD